MALPGSRDLNAVDSGPLPAATVNNIQDAIVGRGHGDIDMLVALNPVRQDGMTLSPAQAFYQFVGVEGTNQLRCLLPLRPGDRLLEWAVFVRDDTAPIDRVAAAIFEADPSAVWALTVIGVQQTSDGTGTDQKIGEDLSGTPHIVLADKPIDIRIFPDPTGALSAGNTLSIYPAMYLRWDHP